jgi:hypothetical protein
MATRPEAWLQHERKDHIMGSGEWKTDIYDEARRHRERTGRGAFSYSATVLAGPTADRRVHDLLNPFGALRESRDSAEHPQSRAVAVMLDVTGSMSTLPEIMLNDLPQLHGLLQRKGYLADPQVLFGAIGDATCDRVPLQVGQFESDNRMDDDLGRLVLEGGGGGQKTESYELALYFFARRTAIDCWEKRRQRGYLFLIGDETAYPKVKADEVRRIIGDDLETSIAVASIVREVAERYHVFYLLPRAASHGGDAEVLGFWRRLLGQNVIELDDVENICETIALTIGLTEGSITLDEGLDHLRETGANTATIQSVSTALRVVPAGRALVRPTGSLARLGFGHGGSAPTTRRL